MFWGETVVVLDALRNHGVLRRKITSLCLYGIIIMRQTPMARWIKNTSFTQSGPCVCVFVHIYVCFSYLLNRRGKLVSKTIL